MFAGLGCCKMEAKVMKPPGLERWLLFYLLKVVFIVLIPSISLKPFILVSSFTKYTLFISPLLLLLFFLKCMCFCAHTTHEQVPVESKRRKKWYCMLRSYSYKWLWATWLLLGTNLWEVCMWCKCPWSGSHLCSLTVGLLDWFAYGLMQWWTVKDLKS